MKVTIYTTSTCPFCKQEKEYLQSRNIVFEERNVESNRDFLTELLAVSNNFAGTPVTKIEKDDGQMLVLKGFTREEFDSALGPVVQMQQPPQEPPQPPVPQPTPPSPQPVPEPPATDTPPPVPEPTSIPQPPPPPPPQPSPPSSEPVPVPPVSEPPEPETPPQQTEKNDALDAILKDLQQKVNDTYSTQQDNPKPPAPQPVDQPPPPPTPPASEPPATDTPPPEPQPSQQPPAPPSVPDFK